MILSSFNDLNIQYWYRGLKTLKILSNDGQLIKLSNGDILRYTNNDIYLNNKLISNIENITLSEFLELYFSILKTKGYKFL